MQLHFLNISVNNFAYLHGMTLAAAAADDDGYGSWRLAMLVVSHGGLVYLLF